MRLYSPRTFTLFITTFVLTWIAFGLSGCTKRETIVQEALAQNDPSMAVALGSASSTDCANGGILVQTYYDLNRNGSLDNGEDVVSSVPVCNGSQGSQGNGAGVIVKSATLGSCPAGGSQLTTFIDKNNDGSQQIGEATTSESTVCNGTSASITVTAANGFQCSTGGVVYTTRTDGVTPVVSVICNGVNGDDGQNAEFQMGVVGPEVEGQSFSACHHDYLYIPDPSSSTRGWLIFRHQFNGSKDQGIGSTGFNLWNVDIADFALVSEDQKVTYCKLNWNPEKRVLTYAVVEKKYGLDGQSGEIYFK
jgi:hypothetical protein